MKLYIKANSDIGYLYIFKHGTGPGTVPRDVVFLKEKDLPNGYTAVWLDRFLTSGELRAYDIPSETEINKYLDRIGYCQKDGDVIPCDEVEACDVTASSDVDADLPTFREFATTEWELLNDGSKRLKLKDLFVYFGTDKQWNASNPGYWYEIRIGDKTYKESKKYSIKNKERCYKAMQRAVSELLQSDNIESCDKVTASTHRYSAGRIEDDGTEDFYYDTGFDSYDEACDWGTNHDCTHIYDRETDEFVPIESCDTKYFANMVSASNDPELDDDFLIEGYYDNQRRGLAESAETSDVSALNELANEYANKGYYIVVHNLTDGVITEFSADNWFNDIAPDGGASLFMSW